MEEAASSDRHAVEESSSASASTSHRSSSVQPSERLVLNVPNLDLAGRVLNVRIYQAFHSSAESADCIGYRITATDDDDNDYALFVSRVKGETLFLAEAPNETTSATGEVIAGSILSHLDIIGNRYRDVGRLVCREPEAHLSKKTRLPRPKTPQKVRNAHLPSKEQDKRASRNKQDQRRVLDAIAHTRDHPGETNEESASPVNDDSWLQPTTNFHSGLLTGDRHLHKSRKSSEASLLNRMANAKATTVWNAELEGIDDEPVGVVEDADDSESDTSPPHSAPHDEVTARVPLPTQKRVLPERKTKYTELQKRRDKERQQRFQVIRPVVLRSPTLIPKPTSPPRHSSVSPEIHTRPSVSKTPLGSPAATSGIHGNELKGSAVDAQPEKEQFLRRKTIIENQKRVFKAEGVFDEALGVEITHERPDRRFHTPEYAPRTPEIEAKKRKSHRKKTRGSSSTSTLPDVQPSVETTERLLVASASAPELASPRELQKVSPRYELPPVELNAEAPSDRTITFTSDENPERPGDDVVSGEAEENSSGEEEEKTLNSSLENPQLSGQDYQVLVLDLDAEAQSEDILQRTPRSARAHDTEFVDEYLPNNHGKVRADAQHNPVQGEIEESPALELAGGQVSPRVECWEDNPDQSCSTAVTMTDIVDSNAHTNVNEERLDVTYQAPNDALSNIKKAPNTAGQVDSPPSTLNVVAIEPQEDPVVVVEQALAPQTVAKRSVHSEKVDKSPSLKRPVNANAVRRGSVMDAAASAIAAAAAAAAVTASTVQLVETPAEMIHTPKNDTARRSAKRRSHDATPARTSGSAGHKRDGPRRSTVHILHHSGSQKFTSTVLSKAASSEDPITPSITKPGLESIASSPPSTASSSSGSESLLISHPGENHSHRQQRQRSQQEMEAMRNSPSYHSKWNKWSNGKQLVDKVSCLQIEEQLLRDPHDAKGLVKLGLKYARWPATSLPAVLLLENASVLHDSNSGHTHEYWNSLGNAHFDVFLRHRKFLPIAIFHLTKSMQALTRAFAYLESAADPLLLLRYSICLYWKKSDDNSNLERADDILRELFAKFSSFCDRDRFNLLFFHFQILCRLRIFGEAIECLNKIMEVHATRASETTRQGNVGHDVPMPYDTNDYLLMLMHCQQVSGDFLQASASFTKLLKCLHSRDPEVLVDGSSFSDRDYLQMWGNLADKCFQHEDYALSSEFYAIAVTYAKDSRVLARLLYHHALCYQAMGEDLKCSAEFKRAKNINRHVVPFAALAEIHARYDDQYTAMLHTPISKIIEEVRQNLHDRAVTALQRMFRRKKQIQQSESSDAADQSISPKLHRSSSGNVRLGMERRRQSIVAALTNLVEESNTGRGGGGVGVGISEEAETAVEIDPHEEFLQRHAATLVKLEKLQERPLRKASSVIDMKLSDGKRSGLLSPVETRPDLRRKHSMDSCAKRLGYTPEVRGGYVEHWEQLVVTSLDLYETRASFFRHISRIRSVLPLVSEAVACCALADATGQAEIALERLHDIEYKRELQLVCDVVDIPSLVQHHFATLTDVTRFPPIKSPTKLAVHSVDSPRGKQSPQCKLPPCASPAPGARKTFRLDSMINDHFQAAGVATGNDAIKARLPDQFEVLDDFRHLNASLLHGWQR